MNYRTYPYYYKNLRTTNNISFFLFDKEFIEEVFRLLNITLPQICCIEKRYKKPTKIIK